MKRGLGFWLLVIAGVVVVAAVMGGLAVVGGPGTARLQKLDDERLDDLRRIRAAVQRTYERDGAVEPSLAEAVAHERLQTEDIIDPTTSAPYTYRVLSDSTYELCATFALASTSERPAAFDRETVGAYEAGEHCFPVDTTDD